MDESSLIVEPNSAQARSGDPAPIPTPGPPSCYRFSATASPKKGGSVTVSPAPNCAGDKYTSGTVVQLTATGKKRYAFSNWSGDVVGSPNPVSLTMTGDKAVTANFVRRRR